ncbi:unnamed protein product, partial [Rotaria sp. Silwood1]
PFVLTFFFYLGDCDPVSDVQKSFHYTATLEQAVAISVSSGNDINCDTEFKLLHQALTHSFVNFDTINLAIRRGLRSRFLSDNFDPIGTDPYSSIPYSIVDSLEHKLLTKQIFTIGPSSDDISVQAHTYHGTPSKLITTLDGIQSIALKYNVNVVHTWDASRRNNSDEDFAHAIELSGESNIILFVDGLDESFEEEDTDRNTLQLPGGQLELIKLLMKLNKPFAILIISDSSISEPLIVNENLAALLWISYFGHDCLPSTLPINTSQLLPIDDYSMNKSPGRTYRYLDYNKAPPLFPFDYGLSYSKFTFNSKLIIFPNPINNLDTDITTNISIINEDPYRAQFVVQLYYEFSNSTVIKLSIRELLQFTKITFEKKMNKKLFLLHFIRDRYAQTTLVINLD